MPRSRKGRYTLQTGMGRPVSAGSLEQLEAAASRVMSPRPFSLRPVPGITYVSGDEWKSRNRQARYRGEVGEQQAETDMIQDINALGRRVSVDGTRLRGPATLAIARASYGRVGGGMRVDISVEDQADDFYPNGFWIQGERLAITKQLGVEYNTGIRSVPVHLVSFGFAELPPDEPMPPYDELLDALPDKVTLGPLGTVRPL